MELIHKINIELKMCLEEVLYMGKKYLSIPVHCCPWRVRWVVEGDDWGLLKWGPNIPYTSPQLFQWLLFVSFFTAFPVKTNDKVWNLHSSALLSLFCFIYLCIWYMIYPLGTSFWKIMQVTIMWRRWIDDH